MPVNDRRGRPQGKCHREQTARPASARRARVKRWGKSPPRFRQRRRHGKPHREQGRIGADGEAPKGVVAGAVPPFRPGWPREARSDAGSRGMAAQARQRAGQNPAYRPSDAAFAAHRAAEFLVPSSAGRRPSGRLGFAPCTGALAASDGLGAVALRARGPRPSPRAAVSAAPARICGVLATKAAAMAAVARNCSPLLHQ